MKSAALLTCLLVLLWGFADGETVSKLLIKTVSVYVMMLCKHFDVIKFCISLNY